MATRRELLVALGASVAALPLAVLAQAPGGRPVRVGFLGAASKPTYQTRVDALRVGLREHGYVEGRNLVLEERWAEGKFDRLPQLAAELVRLEVDVIVTHSTVATRAAKRATSTLPIVIATVGTNPVDSGLVASLARPGANVTGLSSFGSELSAKRLELLKDVVPGVRRVAFLATPAMSASSMVLLDSMARALGVELRRTEVRDARDVEAALSARTDGIVVHVGPTLFEQARAIAILAARYRLPSSGFTEFAEAGGLLGLGIDYLPMFRRAAYFVDRIVKGAKPGDLPMEQPTKFEFVVNATTARAIGVTVPPSVIVRADRVIS